MSRGTSIDELYRALMAVIARSTGRRCWRDAGVQSRINEPYATIQLTAARSSAVDVVENRELDSPDGDGNTFGQTPWGTSRVDCKVTFYRDVKTALNDAVRFRNSLLLEERFYDLWQIAGLVGSPEILDLSTIFRADVEGRTEVRVTLNANLTAPRAQAGTDVSEMDVQGIKVYRETNAPPPAAEVNVTAF